jgi:hypothetical protein
MGASEPTCCTSTECQAPWRGAEPEPLSLLLVPCLRERASAGPGPAASPRLCGSIAMIAPAWNRQRTPSEAGRVTGSAACFAFGRDRLAHEYLLHVGIAGLEAQRRSRKIEQPGAVSLAPHQVDTRSGITLEPLHPSPAGKGVVPFVRWPFSGLRNPHFRRAGPPRPSLVGNLNLSLRSGKMVSST